jgi:hypothetical protein
MRALFGCALLAPPVPPLFVCQSAVVAALKRHSERERERERERARQRARGRQKTYKKVRVGLVLEV